MGDTYVRRYIRMCVYTYLSTQNSNTHVKLGYSIHIRIHTYVRVLKSEAKAGHDDYTRPKKIGCIYQRFYFYAHKNPFQSGRKNKKDNWNVVCKSDIQIKSAHNICDLSSLAGIIFLLPLHYS